MTFRPFRPIFRNPHLATIAGISGPVPKVRSSGRWKVVYQTEPNVRVLVHSQRPGEVQGQQPVGELVLVHGLEGSSACRICPQHGPDAGTLAPYPAGGFSGVTSGAHTITVDNGSGCTAIANITVAAVPGAPAAPATIVTDPTCSTATGTITVTNTSAGLTYSLDNGAFGPYPVGGFSGVGSGPHTITVQNAAGCSAVTNVTVAAQPASPVAPTTAVVDPTCATPTGTITVTSATAGLTFSLDGALPFTAYPAAGYTGVGAGAHTLDVQNAAGCTATANITVATAPGAPAAPTTAVVDPTCSVPTGTITITSPTAGLTFALDAGTLAPYPAGGYTNIASGAHTITVDNGSGCTTVFGNRQDPHSCISRVRVHSG